jgi:hypothetical protein
VQEVQKELSEIAKEFEKLRVDDIDDAPNTPIPTKINTCVRLKPLGVGAGDFDDPDEKFSAKYLAGYDCDKHSITIGDKKKKDTTVKTFPTMIIPPEFSNVDVFNKLMMEKHISSFMQGYSLNVLAYG